MRRERRSRRRGRRRGHRAHARSSTTPSRCKSSASPASAGETCSANNTCVATTIPELCTSDEQCPRGVDTCAETICDSSPFGQCVAAECLANSECTTAGDVCNDGRCTAPGVDAQCEAFIDEPTGNELCDCGCGVPDPDCNGNGCTEPGCEVDVCRFCWDNGIDREC